MTRFEFEEVQRRVAHGVEEHGLRPFARLIDAPIGVVRSVLEGRDVSASNLFTIARKVGLTLAFEDNYENGRSSKRLKHLDPSRKAEFIDELLQLLGQHLDKTGQKEGDFAKSLGMSGALFKSLRKGSMPSPDRLSVLLETIGETLVLGRNQYPEQANAPEVEVDGNRFATVARHDVCAAAGDGYINFDEPPIDHLAFSKDWLLSNGIQPGKSVLITARGQSMEPSIYDGDLVMIDLRKRNIRNGHIYVYNTPTDGTRIKRLELVAGHAIIVRSDNPDQAAFPPEYHTGAEMNAIAESIVGEVVWSGHRWS